MILVTGGTGFVGSHVVDLLVAEGATVRCIVRSRAHPRHLDTARVEVAEGDLETGRGLKDALAGVDTVLHIAGVTKACSPGAYARGNRDATVKLLAASGAVRRFVHVSSLAAVGPALDNSPLSEDALPHPVSRYGVSKLEGEDAVRNSPVASRAVIVRPPVVYGPRDTDVLQVFRAAARGWLVEIGAAERFFSHIYVQDLAEAIVAAARAEAAAGGTYFVAHPKPVSWTEFGQTAARILGRPARVLRVPPAVAWLAGAGAEAWSRLSGKPGIVSRDKVREACCPAWTCDTRRAQRDLAFVARTPLEEGIAATLAWYKERGWLS